MDDLGAIAVVSAGTKVYLYLVHDHRVSVDVVQYLYGTLFASNDPARVLSFVESNNPRDAVVSVATAWVVLIGWIANIYGLWLIRTPGPAGYSNVHRGIVHKKSREPMEPAGFKGIWRRGAGQPGKDRPSDVPAGTGGKGQAPVQGNHRFPSRPSDS